MSVFSDRIKQGSQFGDKMIWYDKWNDIWPYIYHFKSFENDKFIVFFVPYNDWFDWNMANHPYIDLTIGWIYLILSINILLSISNNIIAGAC